MRLSNFHCGDVCVYALSLPTYYDRVFHKRGTPQKRSTRTASLSVLMTPSAVAKILPPLLAVAIAVVVYTRRRRHPRQRSLVYSANSDLARDYAGDIFELVKECFPGEFDDTDATTDIVACLCGFHDESTCTWLLIFDEIDGKVDGRVCALALIVPYHDRLYLSTVCVTKCLRQRGLGTLLLRSASTYAKEVLNLDRLSGSVATTNRQDADRLKRYYQRLGGYTEPPPPMGDCERTTLRIDAPSGVATAFGVLAPTALAKGV